MGERLPLHATTFSALTLIGTTGFGSLLGFIFWILAARRFPSQDVGLASAILTSVALLAAIANLGMSLGIVQFLPEEDEAAAKMLDVAITLVVLATLGLVVIFVIGAPLWAPAVVSVRSDPWFVALIIATAIGVGVGQLYDQAFIARRRTGFVALRAMIAALLSPLLLMVLPIGSGSVSVYAASGGPIALVTLATALFLVKKLSGWRVPRPSRRFSIARPLIHAALPNQVGQLLWLAPPTLFSFQILRLLGAEANGPFYIAWMVANLAYVVPKAVTSVFLASGARSTDSARQTAGRSLALTGMLLVPCVVVTAAVGPWVLRAFGPEYASAATLLQLLLLSALPMAVISSAQVGLRLQHRFWFASALLGAALVLALGLSEGLIHRYHLSAVGLAWLTGLTVVALLSGRESILAALEYATFMMRRLRYRWGAT